MMTFLQILLAVILVIAALIAFGIWWIKRKFRAVTGEYEAVAELQEHLDMRPARLHLTRGEREEYEGDKKALVSAFSALGFRRIGDLCDYDYCQTFHIGQHTSLPIVLAVAEDEQENAHFSVFSVDAERRVVGLGNEPEENVDLPRLDWQADPEMTPEAALEALKEKLGEGATAPKPRAIRSILEQVYAIRMDRKITRSPSREMLERLAEKHEIELTDSQFDIALGMVMGHWKEQVSDAVLDRYRRTSKIDAASWEDMRDEIQVVHARLDNEDLEYMLVNDELGEKIFEDCVEQGLSGLQLFRTVSERLPPDQRWTVLSEVSQPVRAILFEPSEQTDLEQEQTGLFIYQATDDQDKTHEGSIAATSPGDAKAQLERKGFRNPRILTEPSMAVDGLDDELLDEASAKIAARSIQEGIGLSLLRALWSNWALWALPLGFLAHSLYEGPPYTWGDYLVMVWTVASLGILFFAIAPMFLYDQLQRAFLTANTGRGLALVKAIRMTSVFGGITGSQLRLERCRFMSMAGDTEAAMELWSSDRGNLSDFEYLVGLQTIHEADGDLEGIIDTQRKMLESDPSLDLVKVDLASSLIRYGGDVDEVEELIHSVSPRDLSELALVGYQFTRGLLAAKRGQSDTAARHYEQALESIEPMTAMPMILAMVAEINGHFALLLKRSGEKARADEIWESASQVLKRHRSTAPLIKAYEST